MEWPFYLSAKRRNALIKVLRFCYGETMSVTPKEVCPVIATVRRLRLKCAATVLDGISKFAEDVASRDVDAGATMLRNCVKYEECCSEDCPLDEMLCRVVLTKENLNKHFEEVVDNCLVMLKPSYLDKAEYADVHQEFMVRAIYVEQRKGDLRDDEKKGVMSKVCTEHLNAGEFRKLRDMKLFSDSELVQFSLLAFGQTQSDLAQARARLSVAQAKEQRVSPEWQVCARISRTKSETTKIRAGHNFPVAGGAVCDSRRRLILSVSDTKESGFCCSVYLTSLEDAAVGTTKCTPACVPFRAGNHAPVYDGTKYVYFMEYSYDEGEGHRFGRLDIDTLTFEELAPLPGTKFAITFSGCWHNNTVYALDNDQQLCEFDVESNKWSRCSIKIPSPHENARVRLMSNPRDTRHIYAMVANKGLFVIDLRGLLISSMELVSSPPVPYDVAREALLVAADKETFVLVAALENGVWYAFDSFSSEWTKLSSWKPSPGSLNKNYLVFVPSVHSFYYHTTGSETWEAVSLQRK